MQLHAYFEWYSYSHHHELFWNYHKSSAFIYAFEYFWRLKTTFPGGFGDSFPLFWGSIKVFLLGLRGECWISSFLGKNCSTFGILSVPLRSFKFFNSFNLNLFDFIFLSWFSTGVRLVLLGWNICLLYSSLSISFLNIKSFLLSESVELNILLAFT